MNAFKKYEGKIVNLYSDEYECIGKKFLEGYATDAEGFVFEFCDEVIYCSPSTSWNLTLNEDIDENTI